MERYDDLARQLEALASPTRLAILHQLRSPRLLSDIRVQPSLTRAGESPTRPLARQTVTHHVEQLVERGLLHKVAMPDGSGEGYTLHQASLFALADEIRRLAKLRSVIPEEPGETVARADAPAIRLPAGPRLVVAYGREDGAAYALEGARAWRIGRAATCDIRLDHDPWVSSEHATIERTPSGFTLVDGRSLNGTWVDWVRAAPERPVRLGPGALMMLGRTLLVLQP